MSSPASAGMQTRLPRRVLLYRFSVSRPRVNGAVHAADSARSEIVHQDAAARNQAEGESRVRVSYRLS